MKIIRKKMDYVGSLITMVCVAIAIVLIPFLYCIFESLAPVVIDERMVVPVFAIESYFSTTKD